MDAQLRQLERSAASGDKQAQIELSRACLRSGAGCKLEYHHQTVERLEEELRLFKQEVSANFGRCFVRSLEDFFGTTNKIESFEFWWPWDDDAQCRYCCVGLWVKSNNETYGFSFYEGWDYNWDACEPHYSSKLQDVRKYSDFENLEHDLFGIAILADCYLVLQGQKFFERLSKIRGFRVKVSKDEIILHTKRLAGPVQQKFTWEEVSNGSLLATKI